MFTPSNSQSVTCGGVVSGFALNIDTAVVLDAGLRCRPCHFPLGMTSGALLWHPSTEGWVVALGGPAAL